jgi:hypothetical protein
MGEKLSHFLFAPFLFAMFSLAAGSAALAQLDSPSGPDRGRAISVANPVALAAELPRLTLSDPRQSGSAAPGDPQAGSAAPSSETSLENRKFLVNNIEEWLSVYGFQSGPSTNQTAAPAPSETGSEPPPGLALSTSSATPELGREVQLAQGTASAVIGDDLSLRGSLGVERQLFDDFGSYQNAGTVMGHEPHEPTSLSFGLAAGYPLSSSWSLGASLSIKNSQLSGRGRDRLSGLSDWSRPYSLNPTEYRLARLGVQYVSPDWGSSVGLNVYRGEIAPALGPSTADSRTSPDEYWRNLSLLELQGLELSFQHDVGRLNFKAAAMLNFVRYRDRLAVVDGGATRSVAAYLALNYQNPSLVNASFLYRYGSDGYLLTDRLLRPALGSSSSYLDAKVWRTFRLSPSLSLSTQLYGSSLIASYLRSTETAELSPLESYVEGRVTMNYDF